MSLIISVQAPRTCTASELDNFRSLVQEGGEVAQINLRRRISHAYFLAFMRDHDRLVGVAGMKFPSLKHRREVEIGATTSISEVDFPIELGWVYVVPDARGGKSFLLCDALLKTASNKGVFATSRSANVAMHTTLLRLGFMQMGSPWPSTQNLGNLVLFARTAT